MTEYNKLRRTENTKRNVFFGLMRTSVSILLPFFTRSVIIYRFGTAYVGLNSLFTSVLQVLNLTELGFGTAIVYSLYRPVAENDTRKICAYLNYYRTVYRIIGLIILGLGIALTPFLHYLVKDQTPPGALNLYACYFIFLGDSVLGYLLFGYMTSIPTALQRNDIVSKLDIGIVILKNLVQIVLLVNLDNFYFYLFSIPAMTILRNLTVAWSIRRKFPDFVCQGKLSKSQRQELRTKLYGLFANKLFAASRNSIDSLCISAFMGLTLTGIYNNYFYILTGLLTVSSVLCQAMIPGVGNSIITETREKNYDDMRRFDFLYSWIGGWAAVSLLCLYQPFMRLWVGEQQMLGWPEVIGLSLYFYILKAGDMRWIYNEGVGLWWECRYIAIAEAAANIILNILLCKWFGVFGIILATLLSLFFINYLFCPVVLFRCYFKNGKLGEYFKDHLLYFLTILPGGGLCFILCSQITANNIAGFALRMLICLVIPGVCYWLFWRRTKIFRQAVQWVRKAKL